ncbi:MAG: AAA family ATPase, partial [bacterium]|nr:AAA family ATPase [bacterium]
MSKFSRVSIFSGLNNLRDITLSDNFCKLLGYTQNELENYFNEHINITANKFNIGKEELLYEIRRWYNGYSWNGKDFLYNPFSILYFFTEKQFNNYWFTSGTPTFLIKLIKEKDIDIKEFENIELSSSLIDSFEIEDIDVYSLLFQTGYLTIKEIDKTNFTNLEYKLSYPNLEVKESFTKHLLAYM